MSIYTTVKCGDCGTDFKTRENWLFDHQTCPECFVFPDVHPGEAPKSDEFNVYLVSRVQAPPKCGPEANYYRVAARSEDEALWFTEAYEILEYEYSTQSQNRRKLADLEIEDGVANTNTNPDLSACRSSYIEWHDGYTVRELAFRGPHGDEEDQRDLGPNTTDQFTHMTADDYKDVLVHATEEQIDHKLVENVPDDHLCYWTVSGTPRKTRHAQRIWFENDGQIVAAGYIDHVETGRIWFHPLKPVDADLSKEPPSRGFTYLDEADRPEVLEA